MRPHRSAGSPTHSGAGAGPSPRAGRRGPAAARIVGALLMLWGTLAAVAGPATAAVGPFGIADFPPMVVVGQTNLIQTFTIENNSNGVEALDTLTIDDITLVPSCRVVNPDCPPPDNDPGVFALDPQGIGEAGTVCAGRTFNITLVDPVSGKYRFTPADGLPLILGTPGSPTDTCRIQFSVDVLKAPTKDAQPLTAGLQTRQVTFVSGFLTNSPDISGTGSTSDITTVARAQPAIVTAASPSVPVGGQVTDTATLSGGGGPAPGPTGLITFNLYGPNDPTCAGPPVFTDTEVVAGNGTYTSDPFTIPGGLGTGPGTYQWIASYGGDANNLRFDSLCGAMGESVLVTQAVPAIVTVASPPVPIGGTITDMATLSGGVSPTGTITFNLYGPGDTTCATPINTGGFPSVVPVAGNGVYTSAPFTVTTAGTYRWIASYNGDANNLPFTSLCNAPNESVTIVANPIITTVASPGVPLGGGPIFDTATLSNGADPTGLITFTLYGPGDAACATPIFTTTVTVTGNGSYQSPPFTPTTTAGVYRWVASYSGDALNNAAGPTACTDPLEDVVVTPAIPTIVTVASPSVPAGGTIFDTATLAGGAGPTGPTGTITFSLFGPDNATCTGVAAFVSTVPVTGNGSYQSASFTPNLVGTYRWTATYSGDPNNNAVGPTACLDPLEDVLVTPAAPTIVTAASPSVPVGGTIRDTATLAGGATPTGTITFNLYGPNNNTCTGAPAFTATVPVAGIGSYDSPFFTTTTAGTFRWVATYNGDANNAAAGPTACLDPAEAVVVTPRSPTIITNASADVPAGGTIRDTATLSGGLAPTGTITFNLYGPGNNTCTGTPAFTATVPVDAGNGNYDSPFFTANQTGVYRWVASYSGDANNNPAGPTACLDPAEDVSVTPAIPALVTNASTTTPVGGPVSDTATLSGATLPTGSITFNLFGPDNPTCTGTPVFTATVPVAGNGAYLSGPFTPTVAGTYRFVATYSGDANNGPAGPTACTDPAEQVVVTRLSPGLTTTASGTVDLGGPVFDTATLTGGTSPTGTITFNLFGPNDPTCTGTPVFTATVPVIGAGSYQSGPFTPTASGVYRFVATYSGDANNAAVGPTACTDPAEQVLVRGAPALVTTASGSVPEGGVIRDTATLSGGLTPTGTITFNLYGPNDAACSGGPVFTSTVPVDGNGSYPSGDFTTQLNGPAGPGIYRWVASYSGDANNAAVGPTACSDPAEQVVVTNQPPSISVVKTADPLTRPEPGGTFTFTVVVTNPGIEPITITSLTDDIYGALDGRGTCTVGAVLAPGGGTYTCAFPGAFVGDAGDFQIDTVTVVGVDDEGATVTDTDDARVDLTNVPPMIDVVKTADPLTRPEPGGTFTFTVVVTNPGPEPITLTALTDDVYGPLNGKGTCAIGATLAASGGTYSCSFPGDFFGVGGQNQVDTVTATGVDDDGTQVTDTDDATVSLTSVLPSIVVDKTVTPGSRPEPGGTFTFSVAVTNTSFEPLTLTTLIDDVYGDLNGKGTCSVPQTLAPSGGTYTCTFPGPFSGNGGDQQVDTVTGTAVDDRGRTATDDDDAIVRITDTPPVIDIVKTASPLSKPEPGGSFTFSVVVTNPGIEPVTITSLTDDVYGNLNGQGTCAIGAVLAAGGGTYSCTFTGNFTGGGGDAQTDTVTVVGVDDEGTQVTDADDATVTLTDVAPAITVVKTADPLTRPEPGGTFTFKVVVTNPSKDTVTITSLTDDVYGNLSGKGTCTSAVGFVLAPVVGTYTCTFPGEFLGDAGDFQIDTVTVIVVDDEGTSVTDIDDARVELTPGPAVPPPPPAQPPPPRVNPPPPAAPPAPRGPLARTGTGFGGPMRMGVALTIVGFLMVVGTMKRPMRPAAAATDNLMTAMSAVRERLPARSGLSVPLRRSSRRGPDLRWRGAQMRRRPSSSGTSRRRSPWGRGHRN